MHKILHFAQPKHRKWAHFHKEEKMQKYRPGQEVPKTGEWMPHDRNGKTDGEATHLEKGQRFPATQHSGSYYTEDRVK